MILTIDDRPAVEIDASAARAFREWGKLSTGQLRHFAEYGWSQDAGTLAKEIDDALETLAPEQSISQTALRMLNALDRGGDVVCFAAASEVADDIPFRAECESLGIV